MELEKNGREHDQFNQGIIIYYLRFFIYHLSVMISLTLIIYDPFNQGIIIYYLTFIIYNQFNHLRFNHLLIYHL